MYFSNFQLSMVDSPMRDLSYIIYSYSNENTLRNFDFILQVYYKYLFNAMLRLGTDPNQHFPFETLMKEWKKYGMFGVVMNLFEMFDEDDFSSEDETLDHELLQQQTRRVVNNFIHFGNKFL